MAKATTLEQQQRVWVRVLNSVLCLMGAILLGISTLAGPIVQFLLGETWREAAPILALLTLTGLPSVVGFALGPLAITLYRPRLITQRTMIDVVVKVPLMLIGIAWFGLWGAIAARGIAGLAAMIFAFTAATQLTGLTFREQMYAIHRTVAGLVTLTAVSFWLCPVVQPATAGFVERAGLGLEISFVFIVALTTQSVVMLGLWKLEGRPADSLEGTLLGWARKKVN
jgi:O-antigen/teichoic acid export membrane protein